MNTWTWRIIIVKNGFKFYFLIWDHWISIAFCFQAVITSNGHLTDRFKYIDQLRSQKRVSSSVASYDKRVLVLGAGYVVPPLIEYLSRDKKIHITVGKWAKNSLNCRPYLHDWCSTKKNTLFRWISGLGFPVRKNIRHAKNTLIGPILVYDRIHGHEMHVYKLCAFHMQ